jgi:hypothetical protein
MTLRAAQLVSGRFDVLDIEIRLEPGRSYSSGLYSCYSDLRSEVTTSDPLLRKAGSVEWTRRGRVSSS